MKDNKNELIDLSSKEGLNVNGGFIQFLAAAIVGGFIYDCISDPKTCIKGFADGFSSNF
jgi:hypothetical protein